MKKINNKLKRKLRNRKKLKSVNINRFRISVSKSLNNLSAQIIDDKLKKTLVSASSIEKDIKAKKIKKIEDEYKKRESEERARNDERYDDLKSDLFRKVESYGQKLLLILKSRNMKPKEKRNKKRNNKDN